MKTDADALNLLRLVGALTAIGTQANIGTFITPASEAGSTTLRPFSAGTLTICRALGLTMVFGGDKEQVEALLRRQSSGSSPRSSSSNRSRSTW